MRAELALRVNDVTALTLYDKNEKSGIALGTGADGTSWLNLPEKADKPPAALREAGAVRRRPLGCCGKMMISADHGAFDLVRARSPLPAARPCPDRTIQNLKPSER